MSEIDDRDMRNKIFAAHMAAAGVNQASSGAPVPKSAIDSVLAEFGLDMPVDMAPLPSCGLTYPVDHPFHGKESVEIRPMTTREEDILTNKAFFKQGTTVTELIKACLTQRGVDPLDLLTADRNALLVSIRVTGYGAEYKVEGLKCGSCDEPSDREFNLGALEVRRLELKPLAPGKNEFLVTLPVTKKDVVFRFMTGRLENELSDLSERRKKKLGPAADTPVTDTLLASIVSVAGIEDKAKIAKFVSVMPARDANFLRTYIRNAEPGIVMRQVTTCPLCEESEEVPIPIGLSFLWPGAAR